MDEMVEWHHLLDGHEFEQALGVGDGQGSPVCRSPWGHKESAEMHITTTALRDLLVLQIGYMQYIGFISLYDITI